MKTIKLLIISISLLLINTMAEARIVGTLNNGVPVVTISSNDIQQQINALSCSGFTNITFVESHLTYTVGTPSGGYFVFTFTFNPPSSSEVYKCIVSAECTFDASGNNFEAAPQASGWACISQNCSECCPQSNDCSACSTTDPDKSSSCDRRVGGVSWSDDFEDVIVDFRAWLQS